jgi:glutamate dehydrogenase
LPALWAEIESLDGKVPAATQTAMALKARILLERTTRWLLRNRRRPLDVAATVESFAAATAALADAAPGLLGSREAASAEETAARFAAAGVPAELAGRVAHLEALVPSLALSEIAENAGLDVAAVASVYFALAERLELAWLRDRIVALPRDTRWQAMARAALRDDLYAEQTALTAEVLRAVGNGRVPRDCLELWLEQHGAAVERWLNVVGDIRTDSGDLAQLSVAVREIRNLIQTSAVAEPAPTPVDE